jgi:hypothetical protein
MVLTCGQRLVDMLKGVFHYDLDSTKDMKQRRFALKKERDDDEGVNRETV